MIFACLRAGYGLALLTAPHALLRFATGRPATERRRAVVRVLGVRELTQAVVTALRPDAACLVVSAEVDLAHCVSMFGWAVIGNSRRLAVVSAALAGSLAAVGVAKARRTTVAPDPASAGRLADLIRLRNQVAAAVAARTLPPTVRGRLCD